MTDADHAEHARRCRAARAWAGLSQVELAERLEALGHGIAVATIKRTEAGLRKVPADELLAIGEVCEVPPAFMTNGLADLQPGSMTSVVIELGERIERLEQAGQGLTQEFDVFNSTMRSVIGSLAETFTTAKEATAAH